MDVDIGLQTNTAPMRRKIANHVLRQQPAAKCEAVLVTEIGKLETNVGMYVKADCECIELYYSFKVQMLRCK